MNSKLLLGECVKDLPMLQFVGNNKLFCFHEPTMPFPHQRGWRRWGQRGSHSLRLEGKGGSIPWRWPQWLAWSCNRSRWRASRLRNWPGLGLGWPGPCLLLGTGTKSVELSLAKQKHSFMLISIHTNKLGCAIASHVWIKRGAWDITIGHLNYIHTKLVIPWGNAALRIALHVVNVPHRVTFSPPDPSKPSALLVGWMVVLIKRSSPKFSTKNCLHKEPQLAWRLDSKNAFCSRGAEKAKLQKH